MLFRDLKRVGRGYCLTPDGRRWFVCNGRSPRHHVGEHIVICATSKAGAVRLWAEYAKDDRSGAYEINEYYSHGCWGNSMDEISVAVGVWAERRRGIPPTKVI